MAEPEIFISTANVPLDPAPIPVDWILEGTPTARARVLSTSDDNRAMTLVWDCSAGKFNWFYNLDETVHLLEGGMTLTDSTGTRAAKAGDVVFFPAGSKAVWHVDSYVRKVAFIREPVPAPVTFGLRVWKRLTGANKGGGFVIVRPTPYDAVAAAE